MAETRWSPEMWVTAIVWVLDASVATVLLLAGSTADLTVTGGIVAAAAFLVMSHIDRRTDERGEG